MTILERKTKEILNRDKDYLYITFAQELDRNVLNNFGVMGSYINRYIEALNDINNKLDSYLQEVPDYYDLSNIKTELNSTINDLIELKDKYSQASQGQGFEDAGKELLSFSAKNVHKVPISVKNIWSLIFDIRGELSKLHARIFESFQIIKDQVQNSNEGRKLLFELGYLSNYAKFKSDDWKKIQNNVNIWVQKPKEILVEKSEEEVKVEPKIEEKPIVKEPEIEQPIIKEKREPIEKLKEYVKEKWKVEDKVRIRGMDLVIKQIFLPGVAGERTSYLLIDAKGRYYHFEPYRGLSRLPDK
jgi:hypothetical protein